MPDFLLELLSEEIPARMQARAASDLARLFAERIGEAGLKAEAIETYVTPRRLALIARALPQSTEAVSEELKGPRTSAPPQALEGFLRKTGLTQDRLEERDGVWFARIERPGRATAAVLAEAIPAMVRAFPWPKSMRWGAASLSTESLRWVRPLQGVVAMLGEEIVDFEIGDIRSGAATVGHRFHHPGPITLGGASDYVEKLRACHVILDPAERRRIIAEGAAASAREAGLALVEDAGLLDENAGLIEWPAALLGRFDPAFLDVPPEVIRLTMRTNQKYFALTPLPSGEREGEGIMPPPHPGASRLPLSPEGRGAIELAPAFVCVANIEAADGGAAIVAGNEKVLAARLADARFFWEQDLKVPLEEQAKKLSQIVFHEKLGTVADKVDRVAKLAKWLVEEGIVGNTLSPGGKGQGEGVLSQSSSSAAEPPHPNPLPPGEREKLAALAERAARLCKADLVTGLVGEFPELQGIIGGHLARAQGEPDEIADAIRDHYNPVGQGDEVPTAPVTVAVSLADKLDTLFGFFAWEFTPTGSKDPYALRRTALAIGALTTENDLRFSLSAAAYFAGWRFIYWRVFEDHAFQEAFLRYYFTEEQLEDDNFGDWFEKSEEGLWTYAKTDTDRLSAKVFEFLMDRLKVQQREAGVRHDLIDAVFALGGEDDLVRLLARVRALQVFVETPEGADLLAGYKRAANILKKEGWVQSPSPHGGEGRGEGARRSGGPSESEHPRPSLSLQGESMEKRLSYTPENEEAALIEALDAAEPKAQAAVEAEDFEGAMAALAGLRAPVDAFFDKVTVNDPDETKRAARLALLARMRDAVHRVAHFSRIEG